MKAVILAGGGGTRLWPLSTPSRPKQYQKLVSDKYLIQETLNRLDFLNPNDIYVSLTQDQVSLLLECAPSIPAENLIIEPALRDTASAIGLAASAIEKQFPGEVMAIFYADHLIADKEEFKKKILLAKEIAEKENTLNIVEVVAKEPNTNYGYVELDGETETKDVYNIKRFVEKPNIENAKKFVESGNFLWNTGYYVWKASKLLEKYKELKPETYEKLMKIADGLESEDPEKTLNEIYPTLEKISIDYAIMEKVDPKEIRIIKADMGWSDIGNWKAIFEAIKKDSEKNVEKGDAKSVECENCLIYSYANKPVRVLGLKNTVVIDTPDGLVVGDMEEVKKIKEIL
jgi:mannose-1-phosphate guanylyltransferase